jgi:hypothetical protein
MRKEITAFFAQLRTTKNDPLVIDSFEQLIQGFEREARTSRQWEEFLMGVASIVGRDDRTLKEKRDALIAFGLQCGLMGHA